MSKFTAGSKVQVHVPSQEKARAKALHVIDEKQELTGEVVYVHESGNVNVVAYDQVGTAVQLLDVPTTKGKGDEIYVSSAK